MRKTIALPMVAVALALGADGERGKEKVLGPASAWTDPGPPTPEAQAMAFVGENHPELARLLEPLKARNPGEYRKAVGEIAQVSRNLSELKARNPRRHELALESWKARSRVELLAARLAGSPSEEIRAQLRSAIEAKVDAEVARQRYDLEQAEANARKLRESLDRLEHQRDAVVEARFRALQPKKGKARAVEKAVAAPAAARHPENRP